MRLTTNKGRKMKINTVINKFKKIGIEIESNDGRKYQGKSESQIITFWNQNGDVTSLSTCDRSTNDQDRERFIYEDIGYKTFHDSAKAAVEWVLWCDERKRNQ